jgi:hypothetical protein
MCIVALCVCGLLAWIMCTRSHAACRSCRVEYGQRAYNARSDVCCAPPTRGCVLAHQKPGRTSGEAAIEGANLPFAAANTTTATTADEDAISPKFSKLG